jgi:hypothetical protein
MRMVDLIIKKRTDSLIPMPNWLTSSKASATDHCLIINFSLADGGRVERDDRSRDGHAHPFDDA